MTEQSKAAANVATAPTTPPAEEAPLATFAELLRIGTERKDRPPHSYTCPITGLRFLMRALNGGNLLDVAKMAEGDVQLARKYSLEYATVAPTKISDKEWRALLLHDPRVLAGLVEEVERLTALDEGALARGKAGSAPTGGA